MLQLREIEANEYRKLYAHMKLDFPGNELPPYTVVMRSLHKKIYGAVFLEENGEALGYAVVTAPDGIPFALISYLAISPERRGQGYGGELLGLLGRRFAGHALVVEVESPAAAKSEGDRALRERRIRFYQRAGFRAVPTERAVIFGVAMEIMVNTPEDVGSVRKLMRGLYRPSLPSERWLRFIDIKDRARD